MVTPRGAEHESELNGNDDGEQDGGENRGSFHRSNVIDGGGELPGQRRLLIVRPPGKVGEKRFEEKAARLT